MGPLAGVRVIEMAGIGPAPFCGMVLAGMGADVLRIDRVVPVDAGFPVSQRFDLLNRGKRAVAVDLKAPGGVELVRRLLEDADILIEGFRPGVMERLGLAPSICHQINPRLIFGRVTGWGQDGPLKDLAGHDINYIALSGALSAIGPADGPPAVPLNLVGDFAGGALYLAVGLLAALHEARKSGQGQVVDAAMVDGVASLMAMHMGGLQAGLWTKARFANPLDGAAPYYAIYETKDAKYMAVGAIEKRFYTELLEKLNLANSGLPDQNDREGWPVIRSCFASIFSQKTRSEWAEIFSTSDACVCPVLDAEECTQHPHMVARRTYIRADGVVAPASSPRFDRTPAPPPAAAVNPSEDGRSALVAWGVCKERIAALLAAGVVA